MKNRKTGYRIAERTILTVLCVVLGLLLAVLIGATVYAQHLLGRMNYVEPDATVPTLSAEEIAQFENETDPVDLETEFTAPAMDAEDVDFGDGPQQQIGGDDIVNILLIGQDSSSGSRARSDTMILCTFNKKANTITLTSFMRDLYLKIPGYKSNRINASYHFGGMQLLNDTLYENFGVEVDGNVEVNFRRFEDVIDILGGVTLELTSAEAAFVNQFTPGSYVCAGVNHLTGPQALSYARNRNDVDGDFSRTNRQRKLINALIEEYKNKKVTEMLGILSDILPLITTDMSKSDITAYAVQLFPMLETAEIKTQCIPAADAYRGATIDGMSVLVPDLEKNIEILADSLT